MNDDLPSVSSYCLSAFEIDEGLGNSSASDGKHVGEKTGGSSETRKCQPCPGTSTASGRDVH